MVSSIFWCFVFNVRGGGGGVPTAESSVMSAARELLRYKLRPQARQQTWTTQCLQMTLELFSKGNPAR